jgi:hypothetical protein
MQAVDDERQISIDGLDPEARRRLRSIQKAYMRDACTRALERRGRARS